LQILIILDVAIMLLWFVLMGGLEGAFGGQANFFSHALYFFVLMKFHS
jgi:hypothetical protein